MPYVLQSQHNPQSLHSNTFTIAMWDSMSKASEMNSRWGFVWFAPLTEINQLKGSGSPSSNAINRIAFSRHWGRNKPSLTNYLLWSNSGTQGNKLKNFLYFQPIRTSPNLSKRILMCNAQSQQVNPRAHPTVNRLRFLCQIHNAFI